MSDIRYLGSRAQGSVRIGDHTNLLDGELLTIGDKVFEVETGGGVGPGRVSVAKGASAAAFIATLVSAINANKPTNPVSAYIDPIDTAVARIEADAPGALGNMTFTETFSDADNVISGSGLLEYGENALPQTLQRIEYTFTAIDVSAGCAMLSTNHGTPRHFVVDFRDTNGAQKAITARVSIDGTRVKIDQDGVTNFIAGDKATVFVFE